MARTWLIFPLAGWDVTGRRSRTRILSGTVTTYRTSMERRGFSEGAAKMICWQRRRTKCRITDTPLQPQSLYTTLAIITAIRITRLMIGIQVLVSATGWWGKIILEHQAVVTLESPHLPLLRTAWLATRIALGLRRGQKTWILFGLSEFGNK